MLRIFIFVETINPFTVARASPDIELKAIIHPVFFGVDRRFNHFLKILIL